MLPNGSDLPVMEPSFGCATIRQPPFETQTSHHAQCHPRFTSSQPVKRISTVSLLHRQMPGSQTP